MSIFRKLIGVIVNLDIQEKTAKQVMNDFACYVVFNCDVILAFNIQVKLNPLCVIIDVNECSNSPCKNGAACVNLQGSYRCDCKSGFTGKHCETGDE